MSVCEYANQDSILALWTESWNNKQAIELLKGDAPPGTPCCGRGLNANPPVPSLAGNYRYNGGESAKDQLI